ncbi:MAG TPA: AAA family ATPase [Candidatus Paceibacterota bacterium]
MRIKRITKIKKTGILHNFDGSNLLNPDLNFKEINLIFGWNGTGKTTLSRILRCYEVGEVCNKLKKYTELECDIELDTGGNLSQADFSSKQQIRVFNKDFVDENVFQDKEQDGGNVRALFYLGKEKIELTKERKEREDKKLEFDNLEKSHQAKIKAKDKFATDTAKEIKDSLLGIKEFQHYFKNSFTDSFAALKTRVSKGEIQVDKVKLPESDFEKKLKTVKSFEALKVWIEDIKNGASKISSTYIDTLAEILERTVSIRKTIEKLKTDYQLSNWVQSGISIHKDRGSTECEFCGQKLPVDRIDDLEQHFNKDYTALITLVSEKAKELKELKIKEEIKIPDEDTKKLAGSLNELLDKLVEKVESKQKNILEKHVFEKSDRTAFVEGFVNTKNSAEEITKKISNVAKELETSLVADHYNEYEKRSKDIQDDEIKKKQLKTEIESLDKTIKESEKSIKDFKLPADEINKNLERFLGHSELKFEDKEDEYKEVYYEIKRNNEIAFNLSEGEKTAISLIYFLSKLSEESFDLSKGLVFIDDPISSMDSQFLYSAYAFIIGAIEKDTAGVLKVGQFFLSTHNYDFFNLFKKKYWRNKKAEDRRCDLYMLRAKIDSGIGRCANIYELDKLLKNFDSDYQYLYSRLIEFEKASEAVQADLEKIYYYPNIARRVLETFLSFKFPAKIELQAKIDAINNAAISKEIKESVYRFVNIKSHGTIREIEGFSPEVLEPTAKDHILNVLKMMREIDKGHCSEIEASIA